MKRILFFVLLFISVAANSQLMQTNGTPGGYQWKAGKDDSLTIIPRGVDTVNIGATKYGVPTVGALFFKTTDSTLWVRSSHKWNQVTGTGGSGGSGISSLGQGYGVTIVNDSTYDVDSAVIVNLNYFHRTIDSILQVVNDGTIDSIIGISPLEFDFTNRRVPVARYTGDTTRYFIFEAPIQANVYGDTVYVYLDSTGNGNYSIAHHSFGYYLGVFLTAAQASNTYITYDSASGKFVDTLYSRSGNNIDTLFSSKNGVENAFYKTYKKCDELLEGGLVSLSHDLTYDITAAIYRIGCIDYNSSADSVILSPADPDSARIDLIVLDTNGDVVVIEGEVAENPVEPQYDPELYLLLTTVYIPAAATEPLGVTVTTVYDENLGSPTEFAATNGAGLTVNWGNTTNPYHLTKDGLVSSWTNGSNRTISFTSSTNLTSSDYSLLKMFIDLTGNMNNNSSINIRFYYNNTAVTGTITLSSLQGFSKTDVGYQNITIPMPVFFSTTFNRIDIIMTGAGPGLYIDWVQLQGGISNGSTDYVTNIYRNPGSTQVYKVINGIASPAFTDSVGTSGGGSVEYVVSGLGTQVDSSGRAYTVNVDTASSVILSRQRAANTYVPLIRTVTVGTGLLGGGALSSNITLNIDTFLISTRAWRDKLADSLGVIIATKLTANQAVTVTATGDATGTSSASGTAPSLPLTLATVNGNVGSFTNANITVNGKGLITAASNGSAGGASIDSIAIKRYGNVGVLNMRSWDAGGRTAAAQLVGSSGVTGAPDSINIIIGPHTGDSLSSGYANFFLGNNAGRYVQTGTYNIGLGVTALSATGGVVASGSNNVGIGRNSLTLNQSGAQNTAIGGFALSSATTASNNTAVGYEAMKNSTGASNVGIGYQALQGSSSSTQNVGVGYQALASATGGNNVAVGPFAGTITTGTKNIVMSTNTSASDISGAASNNVSIGKWSGSANDRVMVGNSNNASSPGTSSVVIGGAGGGVWPLSTITPQYGVYIGASVAYNHTTGGTPLEAVAIGYLNQLNINGNSNASVGAQSLKTSAANVSSLNAVGNTLIGNNSFDAATGTPSYNNVFGFNVDPISLSGSNQLTIGANAIRWVVSDLTGGSSTRRWTINGTATDVTATTASAALEVKSTTGGFMPPVMTATQAAAISTPADGNIIYVSTTDATFTSVGFWGRISGTWTALHL